MPDLGWLVQPAVFPGSRLAFGLCVGSFLNVVIHRLPKMMERDWRADCAELARRRHACRRKRPTTWSCRVRPARAAGAASGPSRTSRSLSWLALRGKCAGCGMRISPRYPLVELLAGAGAAWSAWHFGFGAAAFGAMLFVWCTIALALIDHETGYLPDDITLPLLWAGLLFNLSGTFVPLQEAVIGAAAGYLTLWSINSRVPADSRHGRHGLRRLQDDRRGGRFRGMEVPVPGDPPFVRASGSSFGVLQMIAARRGWDAAFRFHFGPYIAIAGVAALLWGPAILAVVPALRPF